MIQDGRAAFGCSLEEWWYHPAINTPRGPRARFGNPPPLDQVSEEAPPLPARVYRDTWIVDCVCNGADFVWLDEPLVRCGSCGNAYIGGRWRRVLIPDADTRAAIETALAARPDPKTRNWTPGETVDDLLAENRANEVG